MKQQDSRLERVSRRLHGAGRMREEGSPCTRGIATLSWCGWMGAMLWRHPLSQGRRPRVLLFAAAWQVWRRLPQQERGVIVEVPQGPRLYFPRGSKCAMSSVAFGFGDTEQVFLWRYLRAGDVLVDVGANIGTYGALALSRGAQVEAFEPDEITASVLAENLERNGAAWRLHVMAVGDTDGQLRFSLGLDISNHLLDSNEDTEGVVVQAVRLDTLLSSGDMEAPTVLKIDAEGFDLAVLQGARDILETARPLVIAEVWDGGREVLEFLEMHKYRVAQVRDRFGNLVAAGPGDVTEGNIVGVPEERWNDTLGRLHSEPELPPGHRVRWVRANAGTPEGTHHRGG